MKIQLTKRLVMEAKPAERHYEMRDVQIKGLLLRVNPSGHKAWVVEWARGCRRTLGALSELTLENARAEAAQVMAEALKYGAPTLVKPVREEITLGMFLTDQYALWAATQLKWGRGTVDRIRKGFGDLLERRLSAIDQRMIDRWWADRISTISPKTRAPVGKVTASRELAALRSALSKAVEWELIDTNPLTRIRQKIVEARKVVRYLAPDEERRLRQALAERDRRLVTARASGNVWSIRSGRAQLPELPVGGFADHLTPIVLLAMNTGLRKGELLSLDWGDANLATKMLVVRSEVSKNGRQRHMPLNAEALDLLRMWRRQAKGVAGNQSALSSGNVARIFPVGDFKKAWTSLLKAADIRGFRFHDLRHHFASRLVMNAVDLNTVRELLGHADLKMTLRYAHLAPEHLATAVAKLGSSTHQ
jgi:integrase